MDTHANLKLALGTAQFGLDYGINNVRGKVPTEEVFELLTFAFQNGIDTVDTAYAYGDSEEILGRFINKNKTNLRIISKLPSGYEKDTARVIHTSLKRLRSDSIYGYLIHSFDSFVQKPEIWDELKDIKRQGKISKVGFSLYHPDQVGYLLTRNIQMDIVQVPFNIFDQRFTKVLPLLKKNRVETHVRSVFLQGLVFKNPHELKSGFVKIKDRLLFLQTLSHKLKIPFSAIFIDFAVLNEFVDKVIIGVDNVRHLETNINALLYQDAIKDIFDKLLDMKEDDENLILPFNWKLNRAQG